MGYQVYLVGKRYGGYGVPAICEYPSCHEEIDRGVSYACGGEPYSELGCDLYFCGKHKVSKGWNYDEGEWCKHQEDCECDWVEICERCSEDEAQFDYKPEHQDWIKHILNDESWQEWRDENPDEVKEYEKLYL